MSEYSPGNMAGGLIPASARAVIETARQAIQTNRLLSGEALFVALVTAVNELAKSAPAEHDVMIQAFGLSVTDVRFVEPHALIFHGYDDARNQSFAVAHFTQVVARVVYLPKRGPDKVLTGFAREPAVESNKAN